MEDQGIKTNNELGVVVLKQFMTRKTTNDGRPIKLYFRLVKNPKETGKDMISIYRYLLLKDPSVETKMKMDANSFILVKKYKDRYLFRNTSGVNVSTLMEVIENLL